MKVSFANAAYRRIALLVFALALSAPQPLAAGELRLAMFEEPGCVWCERWHKEIGPAYPKTSEGAAAPLWQLALHDGAPEGVTLARPARFSPTFVLLEDGAEVGRIEGYPGPDFFWPLLGELLALAAAPATN